MSWPTTSDPRTVFVTVRFTAAEAAQLDQLAKANNLSRSEAVRDCVDRVVTARLKRASRAARAQTLAQNNPAGG